jgi:Na+/glutamate symporter
MNEIFNVIFGDYTMVQLFGFLWFMIIGYIIYGLSETTGRDVNSPNTPKKWSWKFWVNDNWRRYLLTILTTYVFFRFYIEFVGHEFTYFEAVMIGLIGDGIGATAKQRVNAVKADRQKIMASIPDEDKG